MATVKIKICLLIQYCWINLLFVVDDVFVLKFVYKCHFHPLAVWGVVGYK